MEKQVCKCGHSKSDHDKGYPCEFGECECERFEPSPEPSLEEQVHAVMTASVQSVGYDFYRRRPEPAEPSPETKPAPPCDHIWGQQASIKRYTASIGGDKTVWPIIVPDASGDLCYYRDHVAQLAALKQSLVDCERERDELKAILNTPETDDFFRGIELEAAHQRMRWPSEVDAGKTHADWFWLVGYLAGKCLHAAIAGNMEKALHHTISTAAALANWHRAIKGFGNMRPGIDTPAEDGGAL